MCGLPTNGCAVTETVFFDGIIVGSFSGSWKCFKVRKKKGLGKKIH